MGLCTHSDLLPKEAYLLMSRQDTDLSMGIAEYHEEYLFVYLFICVCTISGMFGSTLGFWAIQFLVPGYPDNIGHGISLVVWVAS